MELILEYPIWFLLPAALISGGLGALMYLKARPTAHFGQRLRGSLTALRSISAFLIIILLLGPLVKTITQETEKPMILVGIDNSSSISQGKDSSYYREDFVAQLQDFERRILSLIHI